MPASLPYGLPNEPNSHADRYRGRNLLWLLVATCGPAAVLYLRIALAFASEQAAWLRQIDPVLWVLFFASQGWSAWYMRRMLPVRPRAWANTLQLVAVFFLGLLFSLTGAVMLEAFGYSLFIHLRR